MKRSLRKSEPPPERWSLGCLWGRGGGANGGERGFCRGRIGFMGVLGSRRPSPRFARCTPKAERSEAEWVPRAKRLDFGTDIKSTGASSEASLNLVRSPYPSANPRAKPRGTHSASRSPPKLRFAVSLSASGYAEVLRSLARLTAAFSPTKNSLKKQAVVAVMGIYYSKESSSSRVLKSSTS